MTKSGGASEALALASRLTDDVIGAAQVTLFFADSFPEGWEEGMWPHVDEGQADSCSPTPDSLLRQGYEGLADSAALLASRIFSEGYPEAGIEPQEWPWVGIDGDGTVFAFTTEPAFIEETWYTQEGHHMGVYLGTIPGEPAAALCQLWVWRGEGFAFMRAGESAEQGDASSELGSMETRDASSEL